MRPLLDPNAPRHARMFELLRQAHQAKLTAERLSAGPARAPSRQKVQDLQQYAIQSLQQSDAGLRA